MMGVLAFVVTYAVVKNFGFMAGATVGAFMLFLWIYFDEETGE